MIEARYYHLGHPAALIGRGAAGEEAILEAPLYVDVLSDESRAVLPDDTGGPHR